MTTQELVIWMAMPTANPNYRGLIVQPDATMLLEVIQEAWKVYEYLGARKYGRPIQFRFPTGAIIQMGTVHDERSIEDYRGCEYQRIGGLAQTCLAHDGVALLKFLSCNRSSIPGLAPAWC